MLLAGLGRAGKTSILSDRELRGRFVRVSTCLSCISLSVYLDSFVIFIVALSFSISVFLSCSIPTMYRYELVQDGLH